MIIKSSFYWIPVLLSVLAILPEAASKDIREASSSATMKRLILEEDYSRRWVEIPTIWTCQQVADATSLKAQSNGRSVFKRAKWVLFPESFFSRWRWRWMFVFRKFAWGDIFELTLMGLFMFPLLPFLEAGKQRHTRSRLFTTRANNLAENQCLG